MIPLLECVDSTFYVTFVKGQERSKVFIYDKVSDTFTATARAAGRASVTVGVSVTDFGIEELPGVVTVSNAGHVFATRLVEGRLNVADTPRLEFYREFQGVSSRVASISKAGYLYAQKFRESDSIPVTDDQVELYSLFAIAPNEVVATRFIEG
jgi:hypothetical protein